MAEVRNIKGSKFFVSIKVNKKVGGMGNNANRGKLSISYCYL